MNMSADLFSFWSEIDSADTVHPRDRPILERARHGFETKCLPTNFLGPLRTAPLVLLYLSPGLSDRDFIDASTIEGRQRYARWRHGLAPMPSKVEHPSAFDWWTSRTRCLGLSVDTLRSNLAVLNIGAYHSATFDDWPLLAALPSSRATLSWAQEVLFPRAERGERVVICLRAARHWGLSEGRRYGVGLFAPRVTRGGHMHKADGSLRTEAVAAAVEVLAHNRVRS